MVKHVNIPIFIPHLGCPNQCVFCNQRHISGVKRFRAEEVVLQIESSLSTIPDGADAEIAFFGGSFTGIDRSLMIELLEIANNYVQIGRVKSLRCSTRPDYIDGEILDILSKYPLRTIELGLQSVDDSVLRACRRGHTYEDEVKACRMVVDAGFSLVGQMMIGLPCATKKTEMDTADFIVRSGAVGARIYPTVVFCDTPLCDMTERGEYKPMSIEETVERGVGPLRSFIDAGVDVIRVGLCASDNLLNAQSYHSGPNHPAIGEMIMSRIYYRKAHELMADSSERSGRAFIYVPRGELSKAIGQKKENKLRLMHEFGLAEIIFAERDDLDRYELKLVFEGDR